MKRRGPSNVFTVPSWMKNLQAKGPEGTMTPDQVAKSLELNILFNNGDLTKLKNCIATLTPKVPLKNQPFMRALGTGDVWANVQALIDKSNEKLALLTKEAPIEPRRETVAAESGGESHDDQIQLPGDWGDDVGDRPDRSKPRSRGVRALRAAKRGQAEA